MDETLDNIDHKILRNLQKDAGQSLDALSEQIGLSRNACWRRIRTMEEAGVIKARVAMVDPEAVGLGLQVYMLVRTYIHTPEWLEKFSRATHEIPEIQGVYRMTGDLDYLLRARIKDVASYDALYQRLIKKVEVSDVSASFVMEEIKDTGVLPI